MKKIHVVAAVIENNGTFLCAQKSVTRYDYTSHHWEFPGGKIEPNETPQQALHRELQEEMDCEITVGQHIVTVTHRYPDFAITLHAYRCTAGDRHVRLKEHAAVRWLAPTDMGQLEWCAADLPIVRALRSEYCYNAHDES